MHYRRSKTPGATYFFTVVTYRRRPMLCEPESNTWLREAFKTVKQPRPFQIDAIVILPDSSFHRFRGDGIDPLDWAGCPNGWTKVASGNEVGRVLCLTYDYYSLANSDTYILIKPSLSKVV